MSAPTNYGHAAATQQIVLGQKATSAGGSVERHYANAAAGKVCIRRLL